MPYESFFHKVKLRFLAFRFSGLSRTTVFNKPMILFFTQTVVMLLNDLKPLCVIADKLCIVNHFFQSYYELILIKK